MTDNANRTKIIDALLGLLATEPLERIGLDDIAKAAGLSLADLRGEFSSAVAILAAHMKDIDRKVLAADTDDMTEEPPRERLFDVLMRRLDAHSLDAVQSASGAGDERARRALNELDDDCSRYLSGRAQGRAAGAGADADVCASAVGLGERRGSGSCAHHGGTRS
jgi:AcrR family transcriptional regulator